MPKCVIKRDEKGRFAGCMPGTGGGSGSGSGGGKGGKKSGGGGLAGGLPNKVDDLQAIAKKEGIDIDTLSHKGRKSVLAAAINAKRAGKDLKDEGLLKTVKGKAKDKGKVTPKPESEFAGTHELFPPYFLDSGKAVKALSDEIGVSEKRAAFMASTLVGWSNHEYDRLRKFQRTGEGSQKTKKEVEAITEYLDKVPPYKGQISRGLSFDTNAQREAFLKSVEGSQMSLNAHSSFSSEPTIARKFAGGSIPGVVIVAENKSGRSIVSFSQVKKEAEVIVPKGVSYKINRSEIGEKGITYLYVEENNG